MLADVHNIVFGQLGTLAFTMHEIGLSFDEVCTLERVKVLSPLTGAPSQIYKTKLNIIHKFINSGPGNYT